jgi:hypothetical protein
MPKQQLINVRTGRREIVEVPETFDENGEMVQNRPPGYAREIDEMNRMRQPMGLPPLSATQLAMVDMPEGALEAHRNAAINAGTSSGTEVMDRPQSNGAVFGGQDVFGKTISQPSLGFNDLVTPSQVAPGGAPLPTPTLVNSTTVPPAVTAYNTGGSVVSGLPRATPPTVGIAPTTAVSGGTGNTARPGGAGDITQPPTNRLVVPTVTPQVGMGFGNLTPPTLPTITPPTLTNVQPTLPTLPGGTAGGTGFNTLTSGGGTAGSGTAQGSSQYTYQQLLQMYRDAHNGQNPPEGEAGQQAFNEWVGQQGITGWTDPRTTTLPTLDVPAVPGENFRQTQSGTQTGAFNTTGSSNFAQGQTSGQTTAGTRVTAGQTDTSQNVAGGSSSGTSQTGRTTGTVGTDTTTSTGVRDTLGFGQLLQGQVGAAGAADATRQSFLTDLVQTGGANLNSQIEQAVRNSLTGPQTTNAGESARARMGGYAAAEMGRRNTENRLAAANQLAGPTATQTLVGAGTPFLGQTQTTRGTQTTDMTNAIDALTNTSNWQDLVNRTATQGAEASSGVTQGFQNTVGSANEAQLGSATGGSTQTAAGVVPKEQTVNTGGGGCIICTAGMAHGLWRRPRLLRKVTRHKLVVEGPRFHRAARGYFFLFGPLARLALRSRLVSRFTMPVANAVVYEEARIAGVDLPFRPVPWAIHWTWHGLCSLVGRFPVRNDVTNQNILTAAKQFGTFFPVNK